MALQLSVNLVQRFLQFPLWPCSCLWIRSKDFFSFLCGPADVCESGPKISSVSSVALQMSVKPVQKCLQFPLWPCSCLWSWLEDFFSWFVWRLWTVCIHTLSSFVFGPTVVCEDSHKISCSCAWSWSEDWFSWCVWRLWTVCVQILSGFLCGPTVVCEAGLMISSVSSVALQLSVKLVKRFLQLVCVQTVNSIWTDSKLFPLWPCSCLWSWSEDFFSWCAWRLWAVCGQTLSCFLCGPVCEAGQKISSDGVCKDCEQYV